MKFRALSPLDDIIGGLAAETRRELLMGCDPFAQQTPYDRLYQAAANALAQEVCRPNSILADFLPRRTDFGERDRRAPSENFWAVHVSESRLGKLLPKDDGYNWPRCLGWTHQTIIESVVAELREEGLL